MLWYAGKTYTILGTPDSPGVIPRCVSDLFSAVGQQQAEDAMTAFEISYSYMEIYQEKVSCLYMCIGIAFI